MNKEELKSKLTSEGFPFVYEWKDEPSSEYKEHTHRGKTAFYVLAGSIEIYINGEVKLFRKGDRFDAPVGVPHSAKVGPDGCEYIVGEEFEGDTQ
jgi:quercetin dioxygenase-like cupin family protein